MEQIGDQILSGQEREASLNQLRQSLFWIQIWQLILLVMGCVLDFTPNILIMTPVLIPIVKAAGIDPVYFGVMYILNQCLGLLTPPVGAVLNVISTVGKMPMNKVVWGVWPFLLAETGVMALLIAFPDIVLLPLKWMTR